MNTKNTLEEIKIANNVNEKIKAEPIKKSTKKKCILLSIIIFGVIAILIATFFLIAHYIFNLFGSEIYQIAEVERELYSVEYFTESKRINTKMAYTSGELEEIENLVETDFVVMITNKEDLLNTANLVILKSKTQIKDKEAPLNSFDIFDENIVKEFEKNPNGSKYPMAEFHFFENGTIKDIYLPKEMNKDEAQSMIDLINNVIPKLSRNKTEDDMKGIGIQTKNFKNKKSFKEYENPRVFTDKYVNSTFKGSRITKEVERDVENQTINEIRENTNLYLETQEEKDNKSYIDFGIKNYYYNSSSKIILTKTQKEKKEDINLVKRLCSKLNLIESEILIQAIIEKEFKDQNNYTQNISKSDTPISKRNLRNRNLNGEDLWENSLGFNWDILYSNILGQDLKISYFVDLSDGELTNGLIITFGLSTFKLGNQEGLNKDKKKGSEKQDDLPLAQIPLGSLPVKLSVKLGCSLDFDVDTITEVLKIDFSGSLFIKAAIEFGIGNVAKIEAGIKGDFISVNFFTSFRRNSLFTYDKDIISLKTTAGTVKAYAIAKVWIWTVFNGEFLIFQGFQIAEITW